MMSDREERIVPALFVHTKEGVSLKDALTECAAFLTQGGAAACAMLYATDRCYLARLVVDGSLRDETGAAIPLGATYEARVFSERAELRWRHTSGGDGEAALLSEAAFAGDGWGRSEELASKGELTEPIEQSYLLWGESVGDEKDGWLKMASARVGSYFTPLSRPSGNSAPAGEQGARGAGGKKLRVELSAREYLCQGLHGNVFVAEERWLGLRVAETRAEGEREGAGDE